jgi:glycosyltransferase involved in cell wall biosynthesis
MKLSIGVVIPTYNVEAYVTDALDSVAEQTRRPDHVVVVDDGSVDRTSRRVKEWASRSTLHIDLIEQPNQGPSAARNAGIEHLQTELIALLDGDDIWLPHHLRQAERAFMNVDSLVLCFANQQKFNLDGVVMADFLADKEVHALPFEERPGGLRVLGGDVYGSLVRGNYISQSTAVFTRAAARAVGCFDPELPTSEDRDFVLRLARSGMFGFFPGLAARVRVHDSNISHPKHSLMLERHRLAVVMKMVRLADELGLSPAELTATRRAAISQARTVLYVASLRGFAPYTGAVRELLRYRLLRPALNPKHLLRLAARSVRTKMAPA